MDQQPTTPTQTPVQATPAAPTVAAAPTGPVVQQNAPAKKSNKKMLALALLMLAILLVVLGVLGYFYAKNNGLLGSSTNNQTALAPTAVPTKALSPTPKVSVNNQTDVNNALNEANSTGTSSMESELNQAVTESKNL